MGSCQLSLRWNHHTSHLLNIFDELLTDETLVDVTLVCEGKKIKAHKVILSACSPYFRDIFQENPCKHPVVFFKETKYQELKSIVQFMYKGEVSVFQEQLESLLKAAESLMVKGLEEVSSSATRVMKPTQQQQQLPLQKRQRTSGSSGATSNVSVNNVNRMQVDEERPDSGAESSIAEMITSEPIISMYGGEDDETPPADGFNLNLVKLEPESNYDDEDGLSAHGREDGAGNIVVPSAGYSGAPEVARILATERRLDNSLSQPSNSNVVVGGAGSSSPQASHWRTKSVSEKVAIHPNESLKTPQLTTEALTFTWLTDQIPPVDKGEPVNPIPRFRLKKELKSPVWEFFLDNRSETNRATAQCRICNTIISRGKQIKTANTSTLWHHLEIYHKPEFKLLKTDKKND